MDCIIDPKVFLDFVILNFRQRFTSCSDVLIHFFVISLNFEICKFSYSLMYWSRHIIRRLCSEYGNVKSYAQN